MTDISYSFKIINISPESKSMEIIYTSPGRQTLHIGTRMPYIGETVLDVVKMYAPLAYWKEQELEVITEIGSTEGTILPNTSNIEKTLATARLSALLKLAEQRYTAETSGISINGSLVRTDRESQATIAGAYTSLKEGLLTSIDFKTANGTWVTLSLAEMEPIARAVAQHVQSCFTLEKQLAEQVEAATTIEEVEAIVWPT